MSARENLEVLLMALPDYLARDLKVVFVGTSVATASASRGHYYAGPGNKFWELLWSSELTGDRRLIPEQDVTVNDYGIGLTDLVKGTIASSDSLLRPSDYDVPTFLEKMKRFSPKCVAFNGRKAGETVGKYLKHPVLELGLQPWLAENSRVWVLPSSSGSSASPAHFAPRATKAEWWKELGAWLNEEGA